MSRKSNRALEQKPRPSGRGFSHKRDTASAWDGLLLFWKKYRRTLFPALIFLVAVSLFIFLYYEMIDTQPFHQFMAFTAVVNGFLLNLTGRGVIVNDTVVSSSQFAFQIVDLCTGVMPMLILTAAVLAFPSRIKEKILGLVIGIAGLFIINQIRLVSLFYIGAYAYDIFETAHLLVWQSLMILLAIGIWLIWVYKYVRTTPV